jgi:hypothetical protein
VDERVEAVFVGGYFKARVLVGEESAPVGVTGFAPAGVGSALGGGVFTGDEAGGYGVVGGDVLGGGEVAFPGVVNSEA